MLTKLRAWGLIEPGRVAASKALAEHLADWQRALAGRGDTNSHVRQQAARVRRILAAIGARRWQDVKAPRVQAWLAERVDSGDFGPTTANHYQRALHGFGAWLVAEGRAQENPAERVKRWRIKEPRRVRRTLSGDEQRRLLAAAEASPDVVRGLDGPSRALLYRLALETGLRWSELGALRTASFDLNASPATVTLEGGYTKNGKTATLPLKPETAALVGERLTGMEPEAKLFPTRWKSHGAAMLRHDLEAASIPYRNARGEVVDFHSLRHSFVTNLAWAGIHPKVAQSLARHSSITLTMDRYTRPAALETQAEALAKLPSLGGAEAEAPLRATGGGEKPGQELTPKLTTIDRKIRGTVRQYETVGAEGGFARRSPLVAPEGPQRALQHGEADETRTRNLRIDSPML